MKYHIIKLEIEGIKRFCLCLLPQDVISLTQNRDKAIVGFLQSEQADPAQFTEHSAFKEWLNQLISENLPKQALFLEEGKKVNSGYVYAIDKRTKKPKGDIPIQDIIGAINFENGIPVPGSYLPNNNYKLFTKDGLFQLPFDLEAILVKQLSGHK